MSNSNVFFRQTLDKLTLSNGKTVVVTHALSDKKQSQPEGKEEFVLAPNETLSGHLRKRNQAGRVFIDDYSNSLSAGRSEVAA